MNFRWSMVLAALMLMSGRPAGAGIFVEDFSGGAGTAIASLAYGIGSWSFTGGTARVKMSKTSPYVYPDTASLRPTASVFTGDWIDAGIEVVGFKFRSGSPAPSHVYLELVSQSGLLYRRIFPAPPEGEWVTFMASVLDGGWIAVQGTPEQFVDALSDVHSISLMIQRAGALAVEHAVDDFFVDLLPRQGDARITANGAQFSLDALQPGAHYTLQASGSLTGLWHDVQSVAATNRLQTLDVPREENIPAQFYRLRGP